MPSPSTPREDVAPDQRAHPPIATRLRRPRRPPRRRTARTASAIAGYTLVAPALVLLAVFVFYPLARTVYLTFFEYSFLTGEQTFVGFDNYLSWATDSEMWHGLGVSTRFFVMYVGGSMALGLVIALLIDRLASRRFASLYRGIFYFPVVLPAAIVFEMWLWLYNPTLGLFARVAGAVGSDSAPNWLGDTTLAVPALAIMSIWRLVGETVIFFLVGLANIPHQYVEAARLDGASELKVATRITIPLLLPMIFLVFVLRLKVLELVVEPLFMTQGGPVDATKTYGLAAYYLFYSDDRIGYASTWFVLIAIFAVTTAVFAARRIRHYQ